jgi:alpha-D-xyloside xylohydrolase
MQKQVMPYPFTEIKYALVLSCRYRNQTQLMDVALGYVQRSLPISIIVIDAGYWTQFGNFDFDRNCWPDPEGMIATLKQLGIEVVVSIWPTFVPASSNWQEYVNNSYLVTNFSGSPLALSSGPLYFIDATNPGIIYMHEL